MSANRTEHYRLRLWGAGDRAGRDVFNGNAAAVDTALKTLEDKKCEVVLGSYAGNGAANRVISLGFTPKALILVNAEGRMAAGGAGYDIAGGVFFPGSRHADCGLTSGGLRVSANSNSGLSTNSTDSNQSPYFYIAVR